MIPLIIAVSILFVLVLLQYRTLSKQNIKIENLNELCNVVSDQVDDLEFEYEEFVDLYYKSKKKVSKKNNKGE